MPNIKSAKKRVLVSATKQARNKADKTALKTILKKVDADTNADNVKVAVKAVNVAPLRGRFLFIRETASACIIMCRCCFFILLYSSLNNRYPASSL